MNINEAGERMLGVNRKLYEIKAIVNLLDNKLDCNDMDDVIGGTMEALKDLLNVALDILDGKGGES